MKLKKNYVLRQVADTYVVLPLGIETVGFEGMLKLNESGALLWKAMEQGADAESLVRVLTSEYVVTEEQAREDVADFLNQLTQVGCAEA